MSSSLTSIQYFANILSYTCPIGVLFVALESLLRVLQFYIQELIPIVLRDAKFRNLWCKYYLVPKHEFGQFWAQRSMRFHYLDLLMTCKRFQKSKWAQIQKQRTLEVSWRLGDILELEDTRGLRDSVHLDLSGFGLFIKRRRSILLDSSFLLLLS